MLKQRHIQKVYINIWLFLFCLEQIFQRWKKNLHLAKKKKKVLKGDWDNTKYMHLTTAK